MKNLKIPNNSKTEEQVLNLLEQLGYFRLLGGYGSEYLFAKGEDKTIYSDVQAPHIYQLLTLDQLQDRVVLHRNDVSDANWETEGEDQIYIDSSGKSFIFREQGWDKLQRHEMRQAMWEKAKQTPKSENPTIDTTYILLDGESAKKAWVNGSKIQISPIQAIPEWEDLNEKIATLDCFQKKWLFRCKPLTIMINGTELKPWNSIQVNYENFQIKIECIDDESADQSYKALQKVFSKRLNNWSNN